MHQYNFCVAGYTNSHNCSDAAFVLVLSLQTIPGAFVVPILTQFPTHLGNGQSTYNFPIVAKRHELFCIQMSKELFLQPKAMKMQVE